MRYLTSIVAALIRSTSMNALQIYLNEVNQMQEIKQRTKSKERESSIKTKKKQDAHQIKTEAK